MRAYHHEMEILQTFLPHFEKNVFAYANHYVSGAADYFDGIEPLPEEYQMVKRRYSGFFGTDLEILLKGLGIEHIYGVGLKQWEDRLLWRMRQPSQQSNIYSMEQ